MEYSSKKDAGEKKLRKHRVEVLKNHIAHEYVKSLKSLFSCAHSSVLQTYLSTKWRPVL